MKSYDVVEWGQPLQLRRRATPIPHGREVLLRLTHSGVCHTDLHVRDGYFDMGGGKKLTLAERGLTLPITLGHEPLGVVAAVGDAVHGVRPGDAVLVNPWIGCGTCLRCEEGREHLCPNLRPLGIATPGAFATHLIVPDGRYLIDVTGLDHASTAPLACSGLTAYCAVKKLHPIDPRDWIAIVGCGGVGLMALAVLRGLGHERVIACDIDAVKLAAAREAGAHEICNLGSDGLERLSAVADDGLYGILDFVGAPTTVALAASALRRGGRCVLSGLIGGEATLPLPVFGLREIAIVGSAMGATRDLIELIALVRQGRIRLPKVELRPLAAAESALADLANGKVIGRVVLENTEGCESD